MREMCMHEKRWLLMTLLGKGQSSTSANSGQNKSSSEAKISNDTTQFYKSLVENKNCSKNDNTCQEDINSVETPALKLLLSFADYLTSNYR